MNFVYIHIYLVILFFYKKESYFKYVYLSQLSHNPIYLYITNAKRNKYSIRRHILDDFKRIPSYDRSETYMEDNLSNISLRQVALRKSAGSQIHRWNHKYIYKTIKFVDLHIDNDFRFCTCQ